MRFIQILLFVILFSCGNGSGPDSTTATDNNSSNAEAPKEVQLTQKVGEPILGGPADIDVSVEGLTEAKSYLIGYFAENHYRADSANISGGKLSFKNPEGYPQGLYFISLPTNEFIQVILSEDQKFKMSTKATDLVGSMKVEGSEDNKLFYENLRFEAAYNPKFRQLNDAVRSIADKTSQAYKQADANKKAHEASRAAHLEALYKGNEDLFFVKFKKSGQNPNLREGVSDDDKVYFYRKEFWDNVDFSDRRIIRTPVINNKLKRYLKELTPQNPDSIVKYSKLLIDKTLNYPEYFMFFSNWIAKAYEPTKCDLMDPEAVFVNLVQGYFTKERAFWADSMEVYALQQRANEMAQSLVGKIGPNVTSTDPDGNTKSIYDSKADYIVVYMYNPTCEHCMKETPQLVEWYNQWKDKGRDVYAIAIDTNEEEWKAYIKKNNMSFTNVFDSTNRSIYAKYYVDITPEIYVLNKERKIIGKNLKVFQINTIIDRELGN